VLNPGYPKTTSYHVSLNQFMTSQARRWRSFAADKTGPDGFFSSHRSTVF
jgi:hypothetical protein